MAIHPSDMLHRREKALSLALQYFQHVSDGSLAKSPPQFLEMVALIDGWLSGEVLPHYRFVRPDGTRQDGKDHSDAEPFAFLRAYVAMKPTPMPVHERKRLEQQHAQEIDAWRRRDQERSRECNETLTTSLKNYDDALKNSAGRLRKARWVTACTAGLSVCIALLIMAFMFCGGHV